MAFSISNIAVAQDDFKTITIDRYVPEGNGYVLEDVSFKIRPVAERISEDYQVKVYVYYQGAKTVGYKYNGTIYEKDPCGGGRFYAPSYLRKASGEITRNGSTVASFSEKLWHKPLYTTSVGSDPNADKDFSVINFKIESTEQLAENEEIEKCLARKSGN